MLLVQPARYSDYLLVSSTPDALALNSLLRILEPLREAGATFGVLTIVPLHPSRDALESLGVPQYGRRADPAYAQIAASIPAELRRKWRVKLAQEDVLEELLRGYVEGRFKV